MHAASSALNFPPSSGRTPTKLQASLEETGVRKRNDLSLEKLALLGGAGCGVPGEIDRVRLIGELSRLLHEPDVPENTRAAGLTLIGWLARRMPGEEAHALGVPSRSKKRR